MAERTPEAFSVMVKPVGARCNLRCDYCYYIDQAGLHPRGSRGVMRLSTLEKLIRQTVAASPGPIVSFVWHGGEPALAGLDFYRKALELEKRYLPKGWTAWNNLQTNGLLLDREWVRFLRDNRFDVGVSLDGGRVTHDAHRRDAAGRGSWDRVSAVIRSLRDAGVEPDLLCTVNRDTAAAPLEVYDALADTGATWVQFIPVVVRRPDGTADPVSVDPAGYGSFLTAVFDRWVSRDLGRLDVQLFAEMARVLSGGEAGLCWMRETCGRVIVAEQNGGIYSCDHFVDAAHRLGDLASGRLRALAEGPEQTAFGLAKREALTAQCRACPWLTLCHGGCPKDRFGLSRVGEPGQYWLCEGLETLFAHAVPVLRHIMALSAAGKRPGEIMAALSESVL